MTIQLFKHAKNVITTPVIYTLSTLMLLGTLMSCNQEEKNKEIAENKTPDTEKIDTAELLENFKKDQKTHNGLVKFVQDNIDQDKNDTITTYEFKRMEKIVVAKSSKNNLTHGLGYGAFTDYKTINAKGETITETDHRDIHITSLSENEDLFVGDRFGKNIYLVDKNGKDSTVSLTYQSTTIFPQYK